MTERSGFRPRHRSVTHPRSPLALRVLYTVMPKNCILTDKSMFRTQIVRPWYGACAASHLPVAMGSSSRRSHAETSFAAFYLRCRVCCRNIFYRFLFMRGFHALGYTPGPASAGGLISGVCALPRFFMTVTNIATTFSCATWRAQAKRATDRRTPAPGQRRSVVTARDLKTETALAQLAQCHRTMREMTRLR